jgi:uncharacterized protein (DUF433 family)
MSDGKLDELLNGLHSDSQILGGQVCIKGTHIPVTLILDAPAAGEKVDELLRGYLTLTRDDVQAALAYGAKLAHERILPFARLSARERLSRASECVRPQLLSPPVFRKEMS